MLTVVVELNEMKKVPRKNISDRISDVMLPRGAENVDTAAAKEFFTAPREESAVSGRDISLTTGRGSIARSTVPVKRLILTFLLIVAVSGTLWTVATAMLNIRALTTATGELTGIRAALPDARNLEFQKAREKMLERHGDGSLDSLNINSFDDAVRVFGMLFTGVGQGYSVFREFSAGTLGLFESAAELEHSFIPFLLDGRGDELISSLQRVRDDLASLEAASAKLGEQPTFGVVTPFAPADYFSIRLELTRAKNFLDILIPWLSGQDERRFAVLLMNSAELRPGGGFVGSYADVSIQRGAVGWVEVRDVNDPDRGLEANIIPPKPLQAIVRRFRAADANWFFDFSRSAAKTAELMERSSMYGPNNIHFEGVIGITPRVVRDILAVTGPINLTSPKVTITEENFLAEIQKQVQIGQASEAEYPKIILKNLAPIVLERFAARAREGMSTFWGLLGTWVADKDIILYFRNPEFQTFADSYGLTGRVFDFPQDWNGDYLALVNANIGGGKTDVVIRQRAMLQSQIDADGTVTNHLSISRVHGAKKGDAWWYREPNQNYLRILTPPGARLTGASGGIEKKIAEPVNYAAEGYITDSDVAAIETSLIPEPEHPTVSVFRESGKRAFATWSKTAVGETTNLSFDYTHQLLTPPGDGQTYTFVFEKQTGSSGEYRFEITAPPGYHFKENGLPVYEYVTDDPPGRLVLALTFERTTE